MPAEKINIDQFLELSKHHLLIDVRSPGEYQYAHIPCAYNMPLFTDEERAVVGTKYKQESRESAIKIGLDFFGPKMKLIIEEVEGISNKEFGIGMKESNFRIPNSESLLVYCWRGGMRSAAVAWLLDLYGYKVYLLAGGYKKYRNHVLDIFKKPFELKILGGYTGSGKTEVLKELEKKGETIIDLEGIANHKGSAFGNIGMPPQPSQEMFENLLALKIQEITPELKEYSKAPFRGFGGFWLEDESQRIGLINIPKDIWNKMRQSPIYFLDVPFEERLKHLVEEYGNLDKQKMIEAITRIKERLGGLEAKNAINHLQEGNTTESFSILLKYYDKWYKKGLHNREELISLLHTIDCKSVTSLNAKQLIQQPEYHEKS